MAIDLYSGAGGLSLGMEQAGFDVVAAAEMDPIHAVTHRFNFPGTPVVCRDLTSVTSGELRTAAQAGWTAMGREGELGEIDAVVGGPPCQGFSVGGVRNVDDERNNQLLRFVELVVELQPRVFCLENVAGLLEPRFESLRARAVERLVSDGGYAVTGLDRPVNAADYGVPQNRRRVFIMGAKGAAPDFGIPPGPRVTVKDALSGLPDLAAYRRLLRVDSVTLRDEDILSMLGTSSTFARRLAGIDSDPMDLSHPRARDISVLTNSLRTVHTPKTVQRFNRTAPGRVEAVSRLYRLAEDGISRTLRAGTGSDRGSHTSPRPIHPTKARVITVREAARLHGYPDWFRFHATNWHGHRQVGNSVPPPLAASAGRVLVRALGLDPEPTLRVQPLGDPSWLRLNRYESAKALSE